MFKRTFALFATFILSLSAHATFIDFTHDDWSSVAGNTSFTMNILNVGNVTLSASDNMTFNNTGDQNTCLASTGDFLKCDGDGIGIGNDEITELLNTGSNPQNITISFDDGPVNIDNIYLLDLFIESGGAEVAVISSNGITQNYISQSSAPGGFYDTGFYGTNIASIILSGNKDDFSDYALAGIEVSPVPIPGAAILFGSALLGFFGFKRRRTV